MLQTATIAKVQFAQVSWLSTLGTGPSRSLISQDHGNRTHQLTQLFWKTHGMLVLLLSPNVQNSLVLPGRGRLPICVFCWKLFLLGLLKIYNLVWFNINFATHDICCVYQSFLPFFILYFCNFFLFL